MSMPRALLAAAVLTLVPLVVLAAGGTISVSDPYARAVPPGQPNSAAFMSLTNGSNAPRALVSAASPAANTAELHTHVLADGMMQMRKIDRIDIPAGQTVVLAPGGLHVMLIGLKKDLKPGDAVDLTLSFDDGSQTLVKAPVRTIEPMATKH